MRSAAGERLGCLQFGAIMNKVAMKILVQVIQWTCLVFLEEALVGEWLQYVVCIYLSL